MRTFFATFVRKCKHFYTTPFRYLENRTEARRSHELALARLQVEANKELAQAVVSGLSGVVSEAFQVARSQQELLSKWLDALTPKGQPYSSTVREEDEAQLADDRAKERAEKEALGYPIDFAPADALAWLNQTLDSEDAEHQTFVFGPGQ